MATLDGINVFGYVISSLPLPNADAAQVNSFFGVNGSMSLYGGSRGFVVLIEGVLLATGGDPISAQASVLDAEAALLAFADGQGHVYTDNIGRTFYNVLFKRQYSPDKGGIRPFVLPGPVYYEGLPYKLALEVLS